MCEIVLTGEMDMFWMESSGSKSPNTKNSHHELAKLIRISDIT